MCCIIQKRTGPFSPTFFYVVKINNHKKDLYIYSETEHPSMGFVRSHNSFFWDLAFNFTSKDKVNFIRRGRPILFIKPYG